MSEENVELVRAVYECWARGDFRGPADRVAPDFEWRQTHGVVEPGSHVGQAADHAQYRTREEAAKALGLE